MADIEKILNNIAPEYDSTTLYSRGDYVIYEFNLYKCINSQTTGAFNKYDWDKISIKDLIP